MLRGRRGFCCLCCFWVVHHNLHGFMSCRNVTLRTKELNSQYFSLIKKIRSHVHVMCLQALMVTSHSPSRRVMSDDVDQQVTVLLAQQPAACKQTNNTVIFRNIRINILSNKSIIIR